MHRPSVLWQVGFKTGMAQSSVGNHLSIASNGVELAKALAEEGASVFGWDLEWNMNYNINRLVFAFCVITA